MCLILFQWQPQSAYPFIVAANRDEYYERPSLPLAPWLDYPHILAGRDFEKKGTWLGLSKAGRFAALTNYREIANNFKPICSRGLLVSDYLTSHLDAHTWLLHRRASFPLYAGFNLLLVDASGIWYASNRQKDIKRLKPGIYGLSNAYLDTPWPKVIRGKTALAKAIAEGTKTNDFIELLKDDDQPADYELPDTGFDLALERSRTHCFIKGQKYGTRNSTLLIAQRSGLVCMHEQSYLVEGQPSHRHSYQQCLPQTWLP